MLALSPRRYDRAAVMEREKDTRWRRIDPKLRESGWAIAEPAGSTLDELTAPTALTELPTFDGPADYALCDGGRVARRRRGQEAHARPAGRADPGRALLAGHPTRQPRYQGEFGVPFLYSTNGEVIWFHDVRHELNRSRQVAAFHTPTALREMLDRDFDAELGELRTIPLTRRASARTRSRRTRRSSRRSRAASARCSWRWRPAPARR